MGEVLNSELIPVSRRELSPAMQAQFDRLMRERDAGVKAKLQAEMHLGIGGRLSMIREDPSPSQIIVGDSSEQDGHSDMSFEQPILPGGMRYDVRTSVRSMKKRLSRRSPTPSSIISEVEKHGLLTEFDPPQ